MAAIASHAARTCDMQRHYTLAPNHGGLRMMRTMGLCVLLAASATAAGAADVTAPALVVEGGSITALNSTVDLGLSVSVGTTLPRWVPVLGEHIAFVDALTVGGDEAIGASVSLRLLADGRRWPHRRDNSAPRRTAVAQIY